MRNLRRLLMMAGGQSGGASLLLDTLAVQPVLAVSSARKLRTAYTGSALRNRRSSDNAETDIGFLAGVTDTAALLTHTGAGSGFVRTIYDQSTSANNAGQATAAQQNRIVNAGAVDVLNTRAAMTGTATNQLLSLGASVTLAGDFTVVAVCRTASDASVVGASGSGAPQYRLFRSSVDRMSFLDGLGNEVLSSTGVGATSNGVWCWTRTGSTVSFFANGAAFGSGAAAGAGTFGAISTLGGNNAVVGPYPELLVFNAALSTADRTTVIRNMGAFYGITVA